MVTSENIDWINITTLQVGIIHGQASESKAPVRIENHLFTVFIYFLGAVVNGYLMLSWRAEIETSTLKTITKRQRVSPVVYSRWNYLTLVKSATA